MTSAWKFYASFLFLVAYNYHADFMCMGIFWAHLYIRWHINSTCIYIPHEKFMCLSLYYAVHSLYEDIPYRILMHPIVCLFAYNSYANLRPHGNYMAHHMSCHIISMQICILMSNLGACLFIMLHIISMLIVFYMEIFCTHSCSRWHIISMQTFICIGCLCAPCFIWPTYNFYADLYPHENVTCTFVLEVHT